MIRRHIIEKNWRFCPKRWPILIFFPQKKGHVWMHTHSGQMEAHAAHSHVMHAHARAGHCTFHIRITSDMPAVTITPKTGWKAPCQQNIYKIRTTVKVCMSLKINSAMPITKCNLTRWHVAEQNISALLPIFTKYKFSHISRWIT
jgi:hypothetical protein